MGEPMTEAPEGDLRELREQVAVLQTQVALLVQRLSSLETKVARRAASAVAFNDALMDDRATVASRIDHAFERIKGLEVSVFPNLLRDIETVHRIIRGDGVSVKPNPLDSRNSDPNRRDPT